MSTSPAVIEELLRKTFNQERDAIEVRKDLYQGVRIRVISDRFAPLPVSDRKGLILGIVDSDDIAFMELLTAEEEAKEIREEFPPQSAQLPLWADSLAQAKAKDLVTVNLASKDQEQLDPPVVCTFYSLRGGVGRSTALVHASHALAQLGMSVLCVDMDLEAPGLPALFGVEDKVKERGGLVDILLGIEMTGEVPEDLADRFLDLETYDANSRVQLLPAGMPSPAFARDLALIDPAAWYQEDINPLRILLDGVRNLPGALRPDVVLIDSRTGLSPIAAPLLFDVADLAVVAFYPHLQAKTGTALLTRALLNAQTMRGAREGRSLTPEPRFLISPVPPGEEASIRIRQRGMDWVSEWLAPARDENGNKPFDDLGEIVQVVGYKEDVAIGDQVRSAAVLEPYRPIAEWIAGFVAPDETLTEALTGDAEVSKASVLPTLTFGGQTAEGQSPQALDEIFVSTDAVVKALQPSTRLVLGRKGTGKTFLFRRMLQGAGVKSLPVSAASSETDLPYILGSAQYQAIRDALQGHGLDWRSGWLAITALALIRKGQAEASDDLPQLQAAPGAEYPGRAFVADIRQLLGQPDAQLILEDWFSRVDRVLQAPLQLLFEGLDSSFGGDRELRGEVVTGLLVLLNGEARRFSNLSFKVFLREDIFRAVEIPNKSHLRAEAAVLAWNDQYDYLRLVVRQAWRSERFRGLVLGSAEISRGPGSLRGQFDFERTGIEYWPDEIVLAVWRLLVGERMSGGNTAFTHNWVWTRLADANEDHAPRHLVTLFQEAVERERVLEQGSPYSRALIRPRSLTVALDRVSSDALEALEEEFPELRELLRRLRELGRTPFESEQLDLSGSMGDLVNLGEEVGLLNLDGAGRYRVPEIYRRALGMGRQGQQ